MIVIALSGTMEVPSELALELVRSSVVRPRAVDVLLTVRSVLGSPRVDEDGGAVKDDGAGLEVRSALVEDGSGMFTSIVTSLRREVTTGVTREVTPLITLKMIRKMGTVMKCILLEVC